MQIEKFPAPSVQKISFEDFLIQYDGVSAEWVNGVVERMSPVTGRHNRLTRFISNYLEYFCALKDIPCTIFTDTVVMRLGDRGREPDVMLVLGQHSARIAGAYVDGPADLIVEIVSPESDRRDRVEKLQEYESGGVEEYWIIDPAFSEALFYQRGSDGLYTRISPDSTGRYASRVVTGLHFPVTALWQDALPGLSEIITMIQTELGSNP